MLLLLPLVVTALPVAVWAGVAVGLAAWVAETTFGKGLPVVAAVLDGGAAWTAPVSAMASAKAMIFFMMSCSWQVVVLCSLRGKQARPSFFQAMHAGIFY
jgi:hypothetical protein